MPSSGVKTCALDRKSTRLNSSHTIISYAVFCLKKKHLQPRVRYTLGPFRGHTVVRGAHRVAAALFDVARDVDLLVGRTMMRTPVFFFKKHRPPPAYLFLPNIGSPS